MVKRTNNGLQLKSSVNMMEGVITNPTGSLLNLKKGKVRWSIYGLLTTAVVVGYIIFMMLYVVPWINSENLSKNDTEYSVILALTVYTMVMITYRTIVGVLIRGKSIFNLGMLIKLIVMVFSIVRLTWLLDDNMNYSDGRRVVFLVESYVTIISLSITALMILLLGVTVGGDVSKIKIG